MLYFIAQCKLQDPFLMPATGFMDYSIHSFFIHHTFIFQITQSAYRNPFKETTDWEFLTKNYHKNVSDHCKAPNGCAMAKNSENGIFIIIFVSAFVGNHPGCTVDKGDRRLQCRIDQSETVFQCRYQTSDDEDWEECLGFRSAIQKVTCSQSWRDRNKDLSWRSRIGRPNLRDLFLRRCVACFTFGSIG